MITATSSSTATAGLGATSTSASTTATSDADASQDRFLKLLVAQLNNQDPMNPMDNAQMTSQMAQINTVTGIQQVNATLQSMAEQFNAMQMLQGSSLVGHNVLVEGNTLTSQDGLASGAVELNGRADAVKVDIVSSGGALLGSVNMGALPAGRHAFEWDSSAHPDVGEVSFRVNATAGGTAVASTSFMQDKVMSVSSDGGAMTLQLQSRGAVAYNSVKAVL